VLALKFGVQRMVESCLPKCAAEKLRIVRIVIRQQNYACD
jgi:hypothetical protein